MALVGERVPGGGLAQADGRGDVAGANLLDLLTVVGVHLQQTPDALALALGGVVHVAAAAQHAAVDAEEGELADERVGGDLEGQRREGILVADVARLQLVVAQAFDRRLVQRGGQEVDDGVEHRLHALVLERAAAQHRDDLGGHRSGADAADQLLGGQLGAIEVLHHQLVVALGHGLEQQVPVLGHLLDHVGGDLRAAAGGAEVVGVDDRLLLDQVDDAPEVGLRADRQLDAHRVGAEAHPDAVHRRVEVGADAVHLVDEADPGHVVAVGLAPDGLRLGLDPGHGVEHGDGAVEDAEAALHLHGEVHVPGRIDDVDAMAAPFRSRRGRGDGDAALLLLDHPVHRRQALVHLAHLVDAAGVEEDALGGRGLARVDVGHDPDVAGLLERERARSHSHL